VKSVRIKPPDPPQHPRITLDSDGGIWECIEPPQKMMKVANDRKKLIYLD
jgi:hypothetical protein